MSSTRRCLNGSSGLRVGDAVSKGAVLDANKRAEDLWSVVVWIGAGQLHRALAAQATSLHRGGGATFSETFV